MRFESHGEIDAYYGSDASGRAKMHIASEHRALDQRRARQADIDARRAASDARRAASDARRADIDRRAGYRRAGSAVGAIPDMLMSILGVALCLVLMCHIGTIILGGNDASNFFAGETAGINSVPVQGPEDEAEAFYLLGTTDTTWTITTDNGTNLVVPVLAGKHVDLAGTVDWVNGIAGDVTSGDINMDNWYIYAASSFWGFIVENIADFVTVEFEFDPNDTIIMDVINSIYDWMDSFTGGIKQWWENIWG